MTAHDVINLYDAHGVIDAEHDAVTLPISQTSALAVEVDGEWVGALCFEGTVSGEHWYPINAVGAGSSRVVQHTSRNNLFRLTPAGLSAVRVRATAWTSGTAHIYLRVAAGVAGVFANQYLPVRIVDLNGEPVVTWPSTLGTLDGKVQIGCTGTLTTTSKAAATIPDATHTPAKGRTAFVAMATISARPATGPNTGLHLGTAELRIGGTALLALDLAGGRTLSFTEPVFARAGEVIEWVVTPAGTTSTVWRASIVGYET